MGQRRRISLSIQSERLLHSASVLLPDMDHSTRRQCALVVKRREYTVTIRDQMAWKWGHVNPVNGHTQTELLEFLNCRVFFWCGNNERPTRYGERLFSSDRVYSSDAILRIPFVDLLDQNKAATPYFCRYNSGGPRSVSGRKSPRGSTTFLTAEEWAYRASDVVEVSFVGSVWLPETTQVSVGAGGFRRLW
jgi:hypothetical protein